MTILPFRGGVILGTSVPNSSYICYFDHHGQFTLKQLRLSVANKILMKREDFLKLVEQLLPFITRDCSYCHLFLNWVLNLKGDQLFASTISQRHSNFKVDRNASRIGVSTTWKCVKNVCKAIRDDLGPKYIKIPNGTELEDYELRLLQLLSAVDGTHVPICSQMKTRTVFSQL